MQKVLFVITKSNWGGAQRYVFDLATNLDKTRWSVAVALGGTGLPGAASGRLEEELRHKDIRTIFVPAFMRDVSLGAEWQAFKQLYDLFVAERPDVVHLNSSKAGGLGALAARLARVPRIIFTSHGLAWDEDRNLLSKAAIYAVSRLTFLLCHKVITISTDTFERASACWLCRHKIALVHNGIAPLHFLSKEEALKRLGSQGRAGCGAERSETDAEGLPAEPLLWIGAIGELTWNKGYHSLLRAAGILKRRGNKFFLCIVGGGEEQKFLEEIIGEEDIADRVHLAGFVANAYQYLLAFDVFVLPSVKEGLPYVLLEAGAASLPVVASNVGGIPDIVSNHYSGLLVAPKNANELADRLEELLKNPELRKQFGEALHDHVQKDFSLPKMVANTAELYVD